jgi:thiosulfate dehydrogenase
MTMRTLTLLLTATLWAGCGPRPVPAAELGERLFRARSLSTSPYNVFTCATCHPMGNAVPVLQAQAPHGEGRITPGYDLYGVTTRPNWWGGYETRLLDAINVCVTEFMGGAALTAEDERARELYEYLADHGPAEPTPALPLTVVKTVTDLATLSGDAGRGRDVYDRSCRECHGAPRTGAERLGSRISKIPDDTLAEFPDNARAVVVEKVRHGRFFNVGGSMPLYSAEAISDQEIADVLAYLGL